MPTTDTTEKGLETLIMRHMTGTDGLSAQTGEMLAETPDTIAAAKAAGSGWLAGRSKEYDRAHALDAPQLFRFLDATQPEAVKKLGIGGYRDAEDINRQKFLSRLSAELGKRGVIDVLRKGLDHGPLHFQLFYGTPSPGNAKAADLFAQNRFIVTRQLCYSLDETRRALAIPFEWSRRRDSRPRRTPPRQAWRRSMEGPARLGPCRDGARWPGLCDGKLFQLWRAWSVRFCTTTRNANERNANFLQCRTAMAEQRGVLLRERFAVGCEQGAEAIGQAGMIPDESLRKCRQTCLVKHRVGINTATRPAVRWM